VWLNYAFRGPNIEAPKLDKVKRNRLNLGEYAVECGTIQDSCEKRVWPLPFSNSGPGSRLVLTGRTRHCFRGGGQYRKLQSTATSSSALARVESPVGDGRRFLAARNTFSGNFTGIFNHSPVGRPAPTAER
jgi:hypothetical protein